MQWQRWSYVPNEVSSVNGKEELRLVDIVESDSVWSVALKYLEMTCSERRERIIDQNIWTRLEMWCLYEGGNLN